MKKLFVRLFLIAFLANLAFADMKGELVEAFAQGCVEGGGRKSACLCLGKEVMNSFNDKEITLLYRIEFKPDSLTVADLDASQMLQLKLNRVISDTASDENKVKYCSGK